MVDSLRGLLTQRDEYIARLQQELYAAKHPPRTVRTPRAARHPSADEINIEGVRCVSVSWMVSKTGLHQSVISRQLAKLGIKPQQARGSKYYYPILQVENIQRKRK